MPAPDQSLVHEPTGMPDALRIFRRYVTDFVNRHDFAVLPDIMAPDYILDTSGLRISGRDGPYRMAVAKQMRQFPGLQFTVHELFVAGGAIGVRFTEHGASNKHAGARAAWPSVAIYETQGGRLTRCTIEQDYYGRRRQLAQGMPAAVDNPAIAPWDEAPLPRDEGAEATVSAWLARKDWLDSGSAVAADDSRATGAIMPVLVPETVEILKIISGRALSGDTKVAFQAVQAGTISPEFADTVGAVAGTAAHLHFSGLVTVRADRITAGNIIRDRWGLFRRLAPPELRQKAGNQP